MYAIFIFIFYFSLDSRWSRAEPNGGRRENFVGIRPVGTFEDLGSLGKFSFSVMMKKRKNGLQKINNILISEQFCAAPCWDKMNGPFIMTRQSAVAPLPTEPTSASPSVAWTSSPAVMATVWT